MLAPHFVPASFFIRAIILRPLLCMVLMWGDQVSFLSNLDGLKSKSLYLLLCKYVCMCVLMHASMLRQICEVIMKEEVL